MDSLGDGPQVQVRFITQQRQYAIPETAIQTPSRLRRYGLSQIINLVLQNEGAKQRPFDFLIDGEFLRTSLAEYLEEKNMSTENVLTIEYVESMLPPKPLEAYNHDEWVSAVQVHSQGFLSGSYDNHVRIWDKQSNCLQTFVGHSGPVKSVQWISRASEDGAVVALSGAMDRTIIAWKNPAFDDENTIVYECRGHTGGIESIALNADQTMFASGSTDATIKVWTTKVPTKSEHVDTLQGPESRKRRKVQAKEDRMVKASIINLAAHTGPVSAVIFNSVAKDTLYSGGWDHSVRVWDIENHVNVSTKNCEKVVHALDYSPHSGLLASGHSDPVVRLWDPRTEDSSVVKQTLSGHANWVSSVSWSPVSAFMLATGSYDGMIKVWDIRSKGALYTVAHGDGSKKVLDIDWNDGLIVSGGEDNFMRIHEAQNRRDEQE